MLIAFTGAKGSGKDTAAQILVEAYGFKKVAFADKLKESAAACFDIEPEAWDFLKNENTARITLTYDGPSDIEYHVQQISVREFLQRYGTEGHRDVFGKEFWIDAAFQQAFHVAAEWGNNVTITDLRFPNEAEAVRKVGGIVVKILRHGHKPDGHSSEEPLDDAFVNYTLQNDATVKDLHFQVNDLLTGLLLERYNRN